MLNGIDAHDSQRSAGYFTTDKSFFSNTSNQWLDSPNAALYGMNGVGDRPLGDTVSLFFPFAAIEDGPQLQALC